MKSLKFFKQTLYLTLLVCIVMLSATQGYAQNTEPPEYNFKVYLPFVTTTPQTGALIPNQYIVVFRDDIVGTEDVSTLTDEIINTYGGSLLQVYDNSIKGFAYSAPSTSVANVIATIAQDPRIAYIEQDRIVTINDLTISQPNPTWGLDRIDQRTLPLDRNYNYDNTGTGVRVYIIDTGIRVSHNEFGGRATSGFDAVDGALPADDCNGHGTHVAGTVGSNTYGVAKGVQLIAVRVLDCNGSGSYSDVIAGVNWVTRQRQSNPTIPAIANMSLGGPSYQALDDAITASIAAGVTYVVAAGNDNNDACLKSPARVPAAITVGATTSADARASYSNTGGCLDIFAPGSQITSVWFSSDTAVKVLNGTSMAAPHVAGVAALYLQNQPDASPLVVANAIVSNATTNVVSDPGTNSPNRLLFSRFSYGGGGPTWYLRNTNNSGFGQISFYYGNPGDTPFVGDWNGDGIDTIGVYRPSTGWWYLRNSNTTGIGDISFQYGNPGDIQFVGDWNGDGIDTIGVYRPSTGWWYLRNSNTSGAGDISLQYGNPGDIPLAGDWNGDGIDTIGVYRPSTGWWYLRNSNTSGAGDISFQYGNVGDKPLVGDWNGDGIDTIGVYRPSTGWWYLRNSNTNGVGNIVFQYGNIGDIQLVGDWNNDGIDTPGVFR